MGKKNSFYNKQKWEEVNTDSKFLLEDYKNELEVQGKSKGTVYQYASDIRNFLCWCVDNARNKYVLELKRRTFRDFFLTMQRNGSSPARINRMQSSLRNMLAYAYENEDDYDLDRNVMDSIKGVENIATEKSIWLSNDEVECLINHCVEEGDLLKAIFISLSYDSAGRRNEVYQVEKHNFLDENKTYTNKVVGKRNKTFPLVYSQKTRGLVLEYLEIRGDDDFDSLWVLNYGGNKQVLSLDLLYYWTTTLRDVLAQYNNGEVKNFSPHDLRRSALENMENGTHHMLKELGVEHLSLEMVQTLARHEDLSTTKNFYLQDKAEEEFENLFGLE